MSNSYRKKRLRPKVPGYVLVCDFADWLNLHQGSIHNYYARHDLLPTPQAVPGHKLLGWLVTDLLAHYSLYPEKWETVISKAARTAYRAHRDPVDKESVLKKMMAAAKLNATSSPLQKPEENVEGLAQQLWLAANRYLSALVEEAVHRSAS